MDTKEDKIDLLQIFRTLWSQKKMFFIAWGISIIAGIIVAFSIPKTYTTDVILAPEISNGSGLSQNLTDLASMVGVNIGKETGSSVDAIYPEIYPKIISSSPFTIGLFDVKVTSLDSSIKDLTLYNYLKTRQKTTWWDKLTGGFISIFKHTRTKVYTGKAINLFQLTEEQDDIVKKINHMLKCSVDKKNSLITISVTAQDPKISAMMADSVQQRLQEYVIAYRTKKARNDLEYAEKLVREAKAEYTRSQQRYAAYADTNEDVVMVSFRTKQDEMENNMQLRYNIYNQLVQQVQVARAKVQERTPAFTQIQPASVPLKKSGPKRISILLGFTFIATVLTSFRIIFKAS
ncbi:chain-length determining protein [Prevotella sp. A2931]|uniref:Chain-length determining protein n=1 Tax=Prevotella illustrans TaxID=2800387 RepID=A0ABS3M494_9BACT|nr:MULTISPECIES: Wzz/FepE/Etk N-terminal domain-containing protein [Prevotella]MBO1362993.1 chain-length determining protein [Prevotella illustrans]PTL25511.1 chain-length determining protein [Prevotella sp. oral taxon 820]